MIARRGFTQQSFVGFSRDDRLEFADLSDERSMIGRSINHMLSSEAPIRIAESHKSFGRSRYGNQPTHCLVVD
jgi:hypothetical protein